MKVVIAQIAIALGFLATYSCLRSEGESLGKPLATWTLPKELKEVSGLARISQDELAMVQDEKGHIYVYSLVQGQVIREYDFGKKGDYEGIAYKAPYFMVLRSDGDLFFYNPESQDKQHYKWPEKGYEFEGLCLSTDQQSLILACKQHPDKGSGQEAYLYRFDLKKKEFEPDPYRINLSWKGRYLDFRPSAVKEAADALWLLGSNGAKLLKVGSDGSIIKWYRLPKGTYPQPEGIELSGENTIFIANEGKEGRANLLELQKPI